MVGEVEMCDGCVGGVECGGRGKVCERGEGW